MNSLTRGNPSGTRRTSRIRAVSLTLLIPLLFIIPYDAEAVLPQYAMDILLSQPSERDPSGNSMLSKKLSTMLLSHAHFGAPLPMKHHGRGHRNGPHSSSVNFLEQPLTISYPPDETNPLLCQNVSNPRRALSEAPFVLLVPRGECTFEAKAYHAQQLGASAVIIYGTLASRYSINTTAAATSIPTMQDIVYPRSQYDYDCQNGEAWIPLSQTDLVLDQPVPYNAHINDPLLTGSALDNLCVLYSTTGHDVTTRCRSQQCLLTGATKPSIHESDTTLMQGCCAWDLHIWLYADGADKHPPNITIPAAYMTVQQMMDLETIVMTYSPQLQLSLLLYQRWRPTYNISAVLIWLLGCIVATLAAYLSASDYRTAARYHWSRRERVTADANVPPRETRVATCATAPPPLSEEVLELTAVHAAGFVVMASTSLMVLFYFKIYGIVKVFYALGCSTAMAQVIFVPLYDVCLWQGCFDAKYRRGIVVWRTNTEDFGDITVRDIVTHVAGFTFGISWLVMAFTNQNAENVTFFWVMQDVFGACMCISFLRVIRLNNIRVASILLIVAFFYDIFFVFITPHIFGGKSVMITVATSGGPPKADALWCEKYPHDPDCQGGNPLPMLLAIPKLFDYMGGSSLLGLGDIVLPGLLLSFAARYDAAKVLLSVLGGGRLSTNQSYSCPEQQCCTGFLPPKCGTMLCSGGYFGPLIVAYAIGLAMANTAVYVMNMGQPALLYLVPCCLGTIVYIGWRRNELSQLWEGPRLLLSADNVLFPQDNSSAERELSIPPSPSNNLHAPIPTEEGDDTEDVLTAPPSAVDDP